MQNIKKYMCLLSTQKNNQTVEVYFYCRRTLLTLNEILALIGLL